MSRVAVTTIALGLILGACAKKPEPKPAQPAPAQVDEAKGDEAKAKADEVDEAKGDEAKAKADEAKADDAEANEAKADEAKADDADEPSAQDGPEEASHVTRVLDMLAAYGPDKFDKIYADVADDVVQQNIGNSARPKLEGKAALMAADRALFEGFPDAKVVPLRVFDAGDWVIAQVIVSGTHKGNFLGHEATGKPFALEAAFAYHFDADGKIDRIDTFFDAMLMAVQLGLMPAPGGHVAAPVALPDGEVTVVSGAPSEPNAALAKAAYEAFSKDGLQAYVDKFLADDFTFVDRNWGTTLKGKEANGKMLAEQMFAMFPDWKGTPKEIVSVGDWVIVWAEATGTYGGGIPGVEPAGQKVTSTSLDIYRVADGKFAEMQMFSNGMEMMEALQPGEADEVDDEEVDEADEADDEADEADDEAGVKAAADGLQGATEAVKAAGDAVKTAGETAEAAGEAVKAVGGEAKAAVDDAKKDAAAAKDEMKKAGDAMKEAGDAMKKLAP